MMDAKKVEGWTKYADSRPSEAGVYRWRIPHARIEGLVVICSAHMRTRGAGWEQVISPVFDYWDGYRVHVPNGLEWMDAPEGTDCKWYSCVDFEIEGVQNERCPYCAKVPVWEKGQGDPQYADRWWLKCCEFGQTPRYMDPRKLAERRNGVLNRIGAPA